MGGLPHAAGHPKCTTECCLTCCSTRGLTGHQHQLATKCTTTVRWRAKRAMPLDSLLSLGTPSATQRFFFCCKYQVSAPGPLFKRSDIMTNCRFWEALEFWRKIPPFCAFCGTIMCFLQWRIPHAQAAKMQGSFRGRHERGVMTLVHVHQWPDARNDSAHHQRYGLHRTITNTLMRALP